MKKLMFAAVLGLPLCAYAQLVSVGEVTKVNILENLANKVAAISPDGSYLLITTDTNAGLSRYDLATGRVEKLTDAQGAGHDVKISADGQDVIYRENSYDKHHLKKVGVKNKNLATRKESVLVKPTRNLQAMDVQGTTATTVASGKMSMKALGKVQAQQAHAILSIDKLHLMKTENGVTTEFSPLGSDKRYIWPSVSPDGTKALFYVTGYGAYVCSIEGGNLIELGQVRAPRWLNDNIIVGMNDQDDGRVYTSSSIIAVDLNGTTQTLTSDDVIAMYPLPTAAGDKIAFSTPTGEAYIININK